MGENIRVDMSAIMQASTEINEDVARPYQENEKAFYDTIREFTQSSFISNSSKVKAQQILNKKEYLDNMYICMLEYSNFLRETAAEFRNADNRAVDAFHDHR